MRLDPTSSPWTPLGVGLAKPITGWRRGRSWSGGKRLLDLCDPRRAFLLRCRPGARFDVAAVETTRPRARPS